MASPWPPGTAEVFADRTSQTLLPMLVARADLGIFGLLTTAGAVGGLLGTSLHGWITMRVSLGNIMRRTRSRDLHPPRAPLTRHL